MCRKLQIISFCCVCRMIWYIDFFCNKSQDLFSKFKNLLFFFSSGRMTAAKNPRLFPFFFSCCAFFHSNLLPLKALGNKFIAQPSSELCPSLSLHSVLHVSTAKWWGEICLGGYYNFFLSWFWIGKEVMAMLRLRAGDEKTNVRKSALQVQCFLHVFLFCMITQN